MKLLKPGIPMPDLPEGMVVDKDGIWYCEKHKVYSTSNFCLQCEIEKGNVKFDDKS